MVANIWNPDSARRVFLWDGQVSRLRDRPFCAGEIGLSAEGDSGLLTFVAPKSKRDEIRCLIPGNKTAELAGPYAEIARRMPRDTCRPTGCLATRSNWQPRCHRFPLRPVVLRPFLSKGVPLSNEYESLHTGIRAVNCPTQVNPR